jgi:hypothetical protein
MALKSPSIPKVLLLLPSHIEVMNFLSGGIPARCGERRKSGLSVIEREAEQRVPWGSSKDFHNQPSSEVERARAHSIL